MDEFYFSDLKLTSGGYSGRTELIIHTSENTDDPAEILTSLEIVEKVDGKPEKSLSIEYLNEKQTIELYHYLKSCLVAKFPNI